MPTVKVLAFAVFLALTDWGIPTEPRHGAQQDLYGDPLPPGAVARLGTVRLRHGAGVTCVAVSPDSKLIASTGADGAVRVWDAANGRQQWAFQSSGPLPGPVHFSPDGATLVAAVGPTLERWDALSGKPLPRLARHPSAITSILFAPSGKVVASVSWGFLCPVMIRVTDVTTGKVMLQRLPDPRMFVLSTPRIAFSADERMLLMNTSDESIEACKLNGLAPAYTLREVGWIGEHWQQSADGQYVVSRTGGDKNEIIVWDLATGTLRYRLRSGSSRSLLLTADGKRFLLTGEGEITIEDDPTTGKPRVTGDGEPTVEFDLASGKPMRVFPSPHQECVALSLDGKLLAFADKDLRRPLGNRRISIRRFSSPDQKAEFEAHELLRGSARSRRIIFSPDGRAMACIRDGESTWGCGTGADGVYFGASWPAHLELREVPSGKVLARREYPCVEWLSRIELKMLFSQDGRNAISWGSWPSVRVWNSGTGKEVTGSAGNEGAVRWCQFAPDGRSVVTLDETDSIPSWDASTGRMLREFSRMDMPVAMAALSPNGRYLATLESMDGWIQVVSLWDVQRGVAVARMARRFRNGHQPSRYTTLSAVGFAPDGSLLVAGVTDKSRVAVWTMTTAQFEASATWPLAGPRDWAKLNNQLFLEDLSKPKIMSNMEEKEWSDKLSFADNGRHLIQTVAIGKTYSVRLYDLTAGLCLFELPETSRPQSITASALSMQGNRLAFVGVQDQQIALEVWDVATGKRIHREPGWKAPFAALAFSPDGKLLAAGTPREVIHDPSEHKDNAGTVTRSEIMFWDLSTGARFKNAFAHRGVLRSLAFSTDGKRLVSGSADSTVLVWDMTSMGKDMEGVEK